MFKINKKFIYASSFIVLVILLIAASFNTKDLSQNLVDRDRTSTSEVNTAIPTAKPSLETKREKYTEDEARKFFGKFVKLEKNFDLSIFDLYAEDAIMKGTRVYPNGTVREIHLTKDQLKQLAPVVLPLGKQRNDINTYSNIKYMIDDNSIKITATRYNHYKKYTSSYYVILKYVGDELKIIEEFYETIP